MRARKKRAGGGARARATALETVSKLEARARKNRSLAERIAAFATESAGSMAFVCLHLGWFGAWIVLNLGLAPGVEPFDPYPFGFLTFLVSLEAIFLALLVLIAQNRMTKEADRRALLDLQINILAERESTKTLATLHRIATKLGLNVGGDEETEQLEGRTNIGQLAEVLEKKLP